MPVNQGASANVTHYGACASLTQSQWVALAEMLKGAGNSVKQITGRATRSGFQSNKP